jgi:transposase
MGSQGKQKPAPTTRRYTPAQKEQAVRLVRKIRGETGQSHGTVQRVAGQLGYGVESVRSWVRQADIDDGHTAGTTTADAARIQMLQQEVRELRRANEILKRASASSRQCHADRVRRVGSFLRCPSRCGLSATCRSFEHRDVSRGG